MSKCIDNGSVEGFWGILKRARYYRSRFASYEGHVRMIESYIHYNNNRRVQRYLDVLTPMENHPNYLPVA